MSFEKRLNGEFERRKAGNPKFSVRAFARTLGADPGTVAQILRGVRRATPAQISSWCVRLKVPAPEAGVYAALATQIGSAQAQAATRLHHWAEETIALTQNPAHLALLADAQETGGATPLAETARACGCSMDDLHLAMSRLLRLGWLAMPAPGQWRDLTGLPVLTKSTFASFIAREGEAHKKQFAAI